MKTSQAFAACATAVGGAWISLQSLLSGQPAAGAAILITTTMVALAIAGSREKS